MSGLTPMAFAASSGNTEMIRFLVERGADGNHGAKTGEQTALFSAIIGAQIEAVKTLIELKANVNAKMKDGTTPLKWAQKGDQEESIALLGAAGAKGSEPSRFSCSSPERHWPRMAERPTGRSSSARTGRP